MSRTLLLVGADERAQSWIAAFNEAAPHFTFHAYVPGEDVSAVPYCVSWKRVPGLWREFKSLKAIFGLGAGVERLLNDPDLPPDVPVVRMVEPELTRGMVEYVLWQTLYHHRRMWELEEAQAEGAWRPHVYPASWDRTIGILGLGELGSAAAEKLTAYGFKVRGWSRSPKSLSKVESFAGTDQLPAFLSACEILVCLLPLTAETRGILNASLFAQLPKGASLINAARGGHLVEADLLAALKSGQVQAATLDVFEPEPLPPEHPFWTTPRVFVTPHNASITDPHSAARRIARLIDGFEAGRPLENVIDRSRGY